MVKSLRNQGVEAEIATTNDQGPTVLDVPLLQRIEYEQVPVWFFPRFSPSIAPIREFTFAPTLATWLWQHLPSYDWLHVHAIFSYPSSLAMAIARIQKAPYLIRPLGQLCEWSLQQGTCKKQIYLRLIERANLNGSKGLHLTSEQEQQEIGRLGLKAPSFILPHGLWISPPLPDARQRLRQWLNLPADEPILLFLSRLHPKKGLDYLIAAVGKVSAHRFTLIIAGQGSSNYTQTIESLLTSHLIRDRTRLVGFVEGATKDLLLQGADLFALTSHSENFGIAVLEALAAGCPVLVTPGVALASFVQQQQLGYVAKLDVTAIAAALETYFQDPQPTKISRQQTRQLILERYSWEQIAAKLSNLYSGVSEVVKIV
jgi:glycosyltransferase involved in cell wall biosynthesis